MNDDKPLFSTSHKLHPSVTRWERIRGWLALHYLWKMPGFTAENLEEALKMDEEA